MIGDGDLRLEPVGPEARPAAAPPTSEDRQNDEKRRILDALEQTNWNRSRAAEVLGMPRRTFYRRLKEYGIQ